MEETIKDIEVIAYKGMNSDMSCRGFQYEIGETYKTDKAKLCECGFHACLNPREILDYYEQNEDTRYFKVKLSCEITKCECDDTNVAATEITILEEITDIFDEICKNVEWWKTENVLDLLYWSEGLAIVRRSDCLRNFIDKKGNYLSDEWFNDAHSFKDGFAKVQRGDWLFNFIDKKGNYLSDEWFNDAHSFKDGFAKVKRRDGLWNFITKDGKIISDEWFNYLDDLFRDGFARVQRTNGECCKIDKQGKIVGLRK